MLVTFKQKFPSMYYGLSLVAITCMVPLEVFIEIKLYVPLYVKKNCLNLIRSTIFFFKRVTTQEFPSYMYILFLFLFTATSLPCVHTI